MNSRAQELSGAILKTKSVETIIKIVSEQKDEKFFEEVIKPLSNQKIETHTASFTAAVFFNALWEKFKTPIYKVRAKMQFNNSLMTHYLIATYYLEVYSYENATTKNGEREQKFVVNLTALIKEDSSFLQHRFVMKSAIGVLKKIISISLSSITMNEVKSRARELLHTIFVTHPDLDTEYEADKIFLETEEGKAKKSHFSKAIHALKENPPNVGNAINFLVTHIEAKHDSKENATDQNLHGLTRLYLLADDLITPVLSAGQGPLFFYFYACVQLYRVHSKESFQDKTQQKKFFDILNKQWAERIPHWKPKSKTETTATTAIAVSSQSAATSAAAATDQIQENVWIKYLNTFFDLEYALKYGENVERNLLDSIAMLDCIDQSPLAAYSKITQLQKLKRPELKSDIDTLIQSLITKCGPKETDEEKFIFAKATELQRPHTAATDLKEAPPCWDETIGTKMAQKGIADNKDDCYFSAQMLLAYLYFTGRAFDNGNGIPHIPKAIEAYITLIEKLAEARKSLPPQATNSNEYTQRINSALEQLRTLRHAAATTAEKKETVSEKEKIDKVLSAHVKAAAWIEEDKEFRENVLKNRKKYQTWCALVTKADLSVQHSFFDRKKGRLTGEEEENIDKFILRDNKIEASNITTGARLAFISIEKMKALQPYKDACFAAAAHYQALANQTLLIQEEKSVTNRTTANNTAAKDSKQFSTAATATSLSTAFNKSQLTASMEICHRETAIMYYCEIYNADPSDIDALRAIGSYYYSSEDTYQNHITSMLEKTLSAFHDAYKKDHKEQTEKYLTQANDELKKLEETNDTKKIAEIKQDAINLYQRAIHHIHHYHYCNIMTLSGQLSTDASTLFVAKDNAVSAVNTILNDPNKVNPEFKNDLAIHYTDQFLTQKADNYIIQAKAEATKEEKNSDDRPGNLKQTAFYKKALKELHDAKDGLTRYPEYKLIVDRILEKVDTLTAPNKTNGLQLAVTSESVRKYLHQYWIQLDLPSNNALGISSADTISAKLLSVASIARTAPAATTSTAANSAHPAAAPVRY